MPIGPGAPTPSGIPGFNVAYGLTAFAAGGNANATPLPDWLNIVTTVSTTAASVMLPPGYGGEHVVVINHGANSLTVFGYMSTASGDVVTDTIAAHNSTTQVTTGIAVASTNVKASRPW